MENTFKTACFENCSIGLFLSRSMGVTGKEERIVKCSLGQLPANNITVCNKNTLYVNFVEPVGIIGILRTGSGCHHEMAVMGEMHPTTALQS